MNKLLLTITLMMITASVISAQETDPSSDTTAVTMQQTESQTQTQTQAREQKGTENQEQAQTGTNSQARAQNQAANASAVKKVQSARPDWSRARGARPPSVERPSGSRIPKGVGKPAGAKGPGKH